MGKTKKKLKKGILRQKLIKRLKTKSFRGFDAKSIMLRFSGQARLDESPEAIADIPGAKRMIHITADYIYYNCPRYVPNMELIEQSSYSPRPEYTHPEPEWKSRDYIRDVL